MIRVIEMIHFADMLLVWFYAGLVPLERVVQIFPYSDQLLKQLEAGVFEGLNLGVNYSEATQKYPYGNDNELKICRWCDARHIPVSAFFKALDLFMCTPENRPLVMRWLETLPPVPEAYTE